MTSRTFGFVSWLAITAAVVAAAPAPAAEQGDEALRGKTAMSVYVSVYGNSEMNGAELRLSLEQQLHDIGITVLPHGDPPNYPVLNLTIKVETREVLRRDTPTGPTRTATNIDYTNKLELRQLAPGRTPEMRPIEDVAIWTRADPTKTIGPLGAWEIAGKALDLAIGFVNAWVRINGPHPATPDRPMPIANPNAPSPPSNEPGQPLRPSSDQVDKCETRAGGGCVVELSRGVIGSVEGVPNSQRPMVIQQIEDLKKRDQKVITCEYGPSNPQTGTGFAVFNFWYQAAPPDILKLLTSTFLHPFMELGRVAVSACPATRALASQIKGSRFN
jgi:hypothetical protein